MSSSHPISAVDLTVRDLDRSVDFYTRLVGLSPASYPHFPADAAGARTAVLAAGPAALRLCEVPNAADSGWVPDDLQKGFRHIGFTVTDIDRRAAELREQGVRFRMDPKDAAGDVRIAFFYDPDSVLLEFVQGQLTYDRVHDQALGEAARSLPAPETPRFDHVAVTVADLDQTVKFYHDTLGFGLVGQLVRTDDPRGFLISYLHAGQTVLEVFTYASPKQDSPWSPEPVTVGFRDVVFTGDPAELIDRLEQAGASRRADGGRLLVDLDGFPLRVEAAR